MEENERGRERGLPVDAFEGRLEALVRRDVLTLTGSDRERVVSLVTDLAGSGAAGDDISAALVGWFTRHGVASGLASADAIRRAEAFIEYLLDVSAEGEARAFARLAEVLGVAGGSADIPGHAA